MAKRWAEIAQALSQLALASRRRPPHRAAAEAAESRRSESPGALLALAYPDRMAKNRGSGGGFLLANGRGANVDAASALAREPFLVVAEIAGSAAQGRVLLAAPIALADIQTCFAERIENREDIAFDAASASLRGRRSLRLGAIALSEQPIRIVPSEETAQMLARELARLGLDRLPWTKVACAMARPGRLPSPGRRRGMARCLRRCACRHGVEWLAPALAGKTALADLGARRTHRGAAHFAALEPAAAARRPRRRHISWPRPGRRCRSTMRRRRPENLDPRAGTVRPRPSSIDRRRPGAAGGRTAVARAPAGAGDARSAGLLARQLCGGQSRDEGPLSAPSVAGQSAGRRRLRAAPSRAANDRNLTIGGNVAGHQAAAEAHRHGYPH